MRVLFQTLYQNKSPVVRGFVGRRGEEAPNLSTVRRLTQVIEFVHGTLFRRRRGFGLFATMSEKDKGIFHAYRPREAPWMTSWVKFTSDEI
jgi:hypothetical protein